MRQRHHIFTAVVSLSCLILSAPSAHTLSQQEIKTALDTVAESSRGYSECLSRGGGTLEQKTDIKDINGDGVDEIILKETGTIGASFCFGPTGHNTYILTSNGAGGWRTALRVGSEELRFIPRNGYAWPDIELLLSESCSPIWRMQDDGSYEIWKKCKDGKLVDAQPSRSVNANEPVSVGRQVPVEIHSTELYGPPYDHNGSVVTVDASRGVIVYDRPKKSIADTVKPGTILFRGEPWKDGDVDVVVKGVAYAFKKGCQAAAYEVRGMYHAIYGISRLTLEGAAPMRSKTSCAIIGHTSTGPNSKLVFNIAIE